MKNILKLNFLQGYKTYIVGTLMVFHGGSQVAMEILHNQVPGQLEIMELFQGLGIIFLRKAM